MKPTARLLNPLACARNGIKVKIRDCDCYCYCNCYADAYRLANTKDYTNSEGASDSTASTLILADRI